MASSKVMATASTTNQDLPRQPTLCSSLSSLLADLQNQSNSSPSDPSMDDLLKNIYSPEPPHAQFPSTSVSRDGGREDSGNKSVDEVWKEIVAGDQRQPAAAEVNGGIEGITLEDFLTKAGAVREEDVRVASVGAGVGSYAVDVAGIGVASNITNQSSNNDTANQSSYGRFQRFGNGVVSEGGRGRGKRRAVEEPPVDKATQQKQRRMIKNRESAARSRERKQAYTVELESLVTQLEEEHARLLREETQKKNERFKQLMENLIPVVEKRRPRLVLRRVNSWQW